MNASAKEILREINLTVEVSRQTPKIWVDASPDFSKG
jgi:hypothetical protein